MTHTNRNFVLAYVFLVALPLLGFVGILKSGRGLSAPFSVDGIWKIESSLPYASPCSEFLFFVFKLSALSISQSGKSLVVTFERWSENRPGHARWKYHHGTLAGLGQIRMQRNAAIIVSS